MQDRNIWGWEIYKHYLETGKLFVARAVGKSLEIVTPKLALESVEMRKNNIPGRRNQILKTR